MWSNSELLFKVIIRAYKENHLRETIEELLNEESADRINLSLRISALCGVEVDCGGNFAKNIETALNNYTPSASVILQINECSQCCLFGAELSPCQTICPFDAIKINIPDKSIIIDRDRCASCGFCINSCPEHVLIDKHEFIPLFTLLKQ